MNALLIDIETYSDEDITKTGLYSYVESPSFRILLFSYAVDFGSSTCCDLCMGDNIPDNIVSAIFDPAVKKYAHNMAFEITCLSKYFGVPLKPEQWHDTMILGAYLGLPLSLSNLGTVLHLEKQKLSVGKQLIYFFSKPYRGERRLPQDNLEKWNQFKEYCDRDVDTEVLVARKLNDRVPVPAWERQLQLLDYEINKRGVGIDVNLAQNAIKFWKRCSDELMEEMAGLTGLDNPNSVVQLKDWLSRHGLELDTIDKVSVGEALKKDLDPTVRRVLEIRRELGKTSVKKYEAMLNMVCKDGRARGITQYYGTFTGRWAGRGLQTQNLPQNHLKNLDFARQLLADGDYDGMEMSFKSIPDTLSQLIRTALIPSPGNVFHVCDFSAIEARVIAWLSGEEWVLDTFRDGGDIYCATASKMFGVPVEKHGRNAELRQKGKIATLALGYQGGIGALRAMGGDRMGLSEEEMRRIVKLWRESNANTVKLWDILGNSAIACINNGNGAPPIEVNRGITFRMAYGFMFVTLPSGRSISYPRVRLAEGEYGTRIIYERMNQTTKKWEEADTFGGKLSENIVQAVARDILAVVLMRVARAGLEVVFHVHDELIVDAPKNRSLQEIESFFSEPIPWAPGLPLKGAGYSGNYYYKD